MNSDMGLKIKSMRKELNMTLEQLGNAVGVGKSTVRKWETGIITNIRRDKIVALAKALHTTPSYLMGWEDNSQHINTVQDNHGIIGHANAPVTINSKEHSLNQQELALVELYNQLDIVRQAQLIAYAAELAAQIKK